MPTLEWIGKDKVIIERVMSRLFSEAENNNSLYRFENLARRVGSVFKSPQEKISLIPKIHYNISLGKQSIYQTIGVTTGSN